MRATRCSRSDVDERCWTISIGAGPGKAIAARVGDSLSNLLALMNTLCSRDILD